jgi:hypothetical protein
MRLIIATAVAMLGLAAPASADTIANFTLDSVIFSDGGTASGGFTLDLTSGALSNVNITTSAEFDFPPFGIFGTTYTDSDTSFLGAAGNTFTNGATAQFVFGNGVPFDGYGLEIDVGDR